MKMRMVDYLIDRVYNAGAKHIFFVPGTGCMFLTDALARKQELQAISVHHEQAAGMAALTYAKCNETLGACVVTTGCGGTNAVTALLHAWQDNVPCVFISGQAARNQTTRNAEVSVRQMGRQEADIISIVEPISKYATMINSPEEVGIEIDKALYLAFNGRKGPVWIDVPMDIQNCIIDTDTLKHFEPEDEEKEILSPSDKTAILSYLRAAQRPILLIGNGIRLSGGIDSLNKFMEKFKIPVTFSKLGHDLIETDDPLSIGMVGMLGSSRAGNFALANSDLVLCLGCRLSIDTTGYEYEKFAREAKIVVVDIDENEHKKNTIKIDHFIKADAKVFIDSLLKENNIINDIKTWREKCFHWKKIFPVCIDEYKQGERINMYYFADALSDVLPEKATVISDAGNAFFTIPAAIRIKKGQRSITSGGQAEMGYSLPAGIGASYASDSVVIAVCGDGSVMMNLQELETMKFCKRNLKLCVMNNNGYSSIRYLQDNAFRGRLIGCDPSNGISFPDFEKIANAFGIKYIRISSPDQLHAKLQEVITYEGPVFCEVMCVEEQPFLSVSTAMNSKKRIVNRPLEDLYPFMDRTIFNEEMIIKPLD